MSDTNNFRPAHTIRDPALPTLHDIYGDNAKLGRVITVLEDSGIVNIPHLRDTGLEGVFQITSANTEEQQAIQEMIRWNTPER